MKSKTKKRIIISLGGSVINKGCINVDFIKNFKKLLNKYNKNEFVIVCGGGAVARNYQKALAEFSKKSRDLDEIGIKATEINALLLSKALKSKIVKLEDFKKLKSKNQRNFGRILVSHGNVPGHTTDFIAVSFAKSMKENLVVNISKIRFVRSKKNNKLKRISWKDYLKMIPKKHYPGLKIPFDSVASRFAAKNKIKVVFTNNLKDIEKLIEIINKNQDILKFESGTIIY
jgi:uridylate kinase